MIVGAMVSMDGVMQAPGGPEEDPTGGFEFGGWVAPLADVDPVFGEEIGKLFGYPLMLSAIHQTSPTRTSSAVSVAATVGSGASGNPSFAI
jgi:hypothetical protein